MKRFDDPVPMNSPIPIEYNFIDGNGAAIPLDTFSTVHVELKVKGVVYSLEVADFVLPKSAGHVTLASFSFPQEGVWMAQFVLDHALPATRKFGEKIRFTVTKNVENADLDEVLLD